VKPFICVLICVGLIGCSTSTAPPAAVSAPSQEATKPLPATPESIADGKKHYSGGDCAICHGKNGDGKGFLAKDVQMNLHDWHDPASLASFTDAQLFDVIDKGKGSGRGRMPAYHDTEKPEQIWQIVNYIRSLATAAPAQQPNG